MSPAEEKSAEELEDILADAIDMGTFSQILEMDEPGDHDFSSSIVFGFFEQAEDTFGRMDKALEERELQELSALGHFLKGSSATLGLIKVREGCEKIQRYGKNENLDGSPENDDDVCLKRIGEALETVKADYFDAEARLREYFDNLG